MSDVQDILRISYGLQQIMARARNGAADADMFLAMEQSNFVGLVAEAKWSIGSALGHLNTFGLEIANVVLRDQGNKYGKPSFSCVSNVDALVRAAATQIGRKEAKSPVAPFVAVSTPTAPPYVNGARIVAIKALSGGSFDFAKLAQLCRELNAAYASDSYYSTAMLVRSITDHVPPVFGKRTFPEVAANYAGTVSFKKSMKHLDGSLRNIADAFLHEQIRKREGMPSSQQVDFRQDLDVLLGEIVRIVEPVKVDGSRS